MNPGYIECTISSTNCSADKSSGSILAVDTVITWTAYSGYHFGDDRTQTTTTATVALGTTSYSATALINQMRVYFSAAADPSGSGSAGSWASSYIDVPLGTQ